MVDSAFAERFSERFKLLGEVSQRITSILEIDELLTEVARLIQQAFSYYHVGIGLIEGDEVAYRVGAGELWDEPNFQFKPQRLKIGLEGLTGWVAATGKPIIAPDVTRDPRYVWMQGSRTQSELITPIAVKGKIIGVLDVQSQHTNDFEQIDLDLMQAIASQTGVAIENARLFAETQRLLEESEQRADELEIINSMQLGLASKLDMKGIYELVGEKLRGIFGVHGIVIYIFDHERHLVIDEYAYEKGRTYEVLPLKMTPLHNRIISTGETICIQQNAKRFFEENKHTMPAGEMPRSFIIVPFKIQGRVAGMIGIFDIDQEFAFSESDVRLMETLANSMAVALESARLFAETQRLLKETEQRAGELGIINSVQQELASKLDVQSIYELIGDTFHNFFNAQVVVISAYDAQTNTVEHRYAIERGRRIPWPGVHPPGGFRDEIIRTKKPFLVNTNVGDTATRLSQPILQGTDTPKSWLGVPIMLGDQVTGILSVQNVDEENAFGESDVRLLQTFAASMSVALENAQLYKNAKKAAALEERQHLARELHDSVTQSLYGITLYSQAAEGHLAAENFEQADKHLKEIIETSQEALAEMRLLIHQLRPPVLDKEGLLTALQARLSAVEGRAGLKTSLKTNLTTRLPFTTEEGLYHIAQEALNNTLKHAHAKSVNVSLCQNGLMITMEIADDGVGFNVARAYQEGKMGLPDMEDHATEIGGKMKVESEAGCGTRVRVDVIL